jgi:hypothetical protein
MARSLEYFVVVSARPIEGVERIGGDEDNEANQQSGARRHKRNREVLGSENKAMRGIKLKQTKPKPLKLKPKPKPNKNKNNKNKNKNKNKNNNNNYKNIHLK